MQRQWLLCSLSAPLDTHSFHVGSGLVAKLPTGTVLEERTCNNWVLLCYNVLSSNQRGRDCCSATQRQEELERAEVAWMNTVTVLSLMDLKH